MMLLSEAAKAINGQLIGKDVLLSSVDTDSRHIAVGQLFVALKGERFDGHDFAAQAIQQGAAAVMLERQVAEPALLVANTYQALGELAAYWRSQFAIPLIAVTGSNGKTTVKEMLASILKAATGSEDAVLATKGNLNNHIGVPLTLLKLNVQHRYAVIEMGMNHAGEISYLTDIAKPTVAIINNAGNAHWGELGSFEAIAKAKGEIFEGLADDGMAVINADDMFVPLWLDLKSQRRSLTFGLKNQADVSATYQLQKDGSMLDMVTPVGNISVCIPAAGLHNVMNALAATTAAIAIEVPLNIIAVGLSSYAGVKGRLQHFTGQKGALVIDDTYNANPMSMQAAIDVLVARTGKKLLVLGDMGELGENASKMHAELGQYAKTAGVDAVFTLGELSAEISRTFGVGAKHYLTVQDLISDLIEQMSADCTVLVKGSRFMEMERVVHEVLSQNESNNTERAQ